MSWLTVDAHARCRASGEVKLLPAVSIAFVGTRMSRAHRSRRAISTESSSQPVRTAGDLLCASMVLLVVNRTGRRASMSWPRGSSSPAGSSIHAGADVRPDRRTAARSSFSDQFLRPWSFWPAISQLLAAAKASGRPLQLVKAVSSSYRMAEKAAASFSLRARWASRRPENLRLEEFPVPTPGPGEVLLRTLWLSLDPYMRGRMSDAPILRRAGRDRRGDGRRHGQRGRSRRTIRTLPTGDIVLGRTGWQTHAGLGRQRACARSIRSLAPISTALGVLGMPGMTAYAGLLRSRQAAGGRDAGGCGRVRRGRLGGRPDREDQGRCARSASPAARTNAAM